MGGKKGKMTDFGSSPEKWKATQYLRELPAAISTARESIKINFVDRSKKPSMTYKHLNFLVKDRLTDDAKREAEGRESMYRFSNFGKDNKEKEYYDRKVLGTSVIINSCWQKIKSGKIASLSEMSLKSIAANLSCYDTENLQKLLGSLPPHLTELFSLLCAQHQTINDENLDCLANKNIQYLFLGDGITDIGITKFISTRGNFRHYENEIPESWWECAAEAHDLPYNHSVLTQLTLLGCSISFLGLSIIRQHFSSIERLVLHDINFKNDFESSSKTFAVTFCGIFSGWPCLTELHLSFCRWVTIDALETLIGVLRNMKVTPMKCGNFRELHSDVDFQPKSVYLSRIVVTGVYQAQPILATRLQNLILNFQKFCNISLIVSV